MPRVILTTCLHPTPPNASEHSNSSPRAFLGMLRKGGCAQLLRLNHKELCRDLSPLGRFQLQLLEGLVLAGQGVRHLVLLHNLRVVGAVARLPPLVDLDVAGP
eukprot:4576719-Alexandrium_andersonii.AAC.1